MLIIFLNIYYTWHFPLNVQIITSYLQVSKSIVKCSIFDYTVSIQCLISIYFVILQKTPEWQNSFHTREQHLQSSARFVTSCSIQLSLSGVAQELKLVMADEMDARNPRLRGRRVPARRNFHTKDSWPSDRNIRDIKLKFPPFPVPWSQDVSRTLAKLAKIINIHIIARSRPEF